MSHSAVAKSLFDPSRRPFLLRKLHSLTGILPVGGFMVFHLWTNAKALQGQERFDNAVGEISHMPYLPVLEAGILLPLLFHAVYGVKLALESKPNVGHYTYSRNWMYTLQRATGLVAFGFILLHLSEYWLRKVTGSLQASQFYPALCENLSTTVAGGIPIYALIYFLGIAACAFHFANGLWGFCFSWGITVSRRAQRMSATIFGLVGIAILFLGANTVLYFATGSRFYMPNDLFGSRHEGDSLMRSCVDLPPPGATTHPTMAP